MRLALGLAFLCALPLINAQASVRTYFNQRTTSRYVDPYKGVARYGDNLEAVLLAEMDKARRSIWVAVQEIRLPGIAKKLVEKYQAGLDVRVVIENSYNHTVLERPSNASPAGEDPDEGDYNEVRYRELVALVDLDRNGRITQSELAQQDAIYILRAAKVPLRDDSSDGSRGSGLMHHKFTIIDGRTMVLGSANYTPSCMHGDLLVPNSRGNVNGQMVIEGAALAKLFAEEHSQLWSGHFGMGKTYRGPRSVTVDGQRFTVQFSPTSRALDWSASTNGLIAKTILTAREWVAAPLFVFSEQRLANAMETVHKSRDADIGVMVDAKFAFRPYSEVLDLLGVEVLSSSTCQPEEANNQLWNPSIAHAGVTNLPEGDVLHHKFAVVDGKRVVMGSHNWSEAANNINDEFALVVDDAGVAGEFLTEYQRLAANARWGLPKSLRTQIDTLSQNCHRH